MRILNKYTLLFLLVILQCCSESNLDNIASKIEIKGDESTFKETIGTLNYDYGLKSWVIVPDSNYSNPFTLDSSKVKLLVENPSDSLLQMINDVVWVDGFYKKVYSDVYKITINKIFTYESSKSPVAIVNEECATPEVTPPSWVLFEYYGLSRSSESLTNIYTKEYQFNVYVHVIRSSAGTSNISKVYSVPSTVISTLNKYFADSNISFKLSGSEFVDSDAYNNLPSSQIKYIFEQNPHSDAIDIYVTGSTAMGDLKGCAKGIPSTACVIQSVYYASRTMAHEVGHCLGLYHTHKGTYKNESGEPELVDGSNSHIAGDFIVDTPADPNIWVDDFYAGGDLTDANGDLYSPDPLNLMSYSSGSKHFTQGQYNRINNMISKKYELLATCKTIYTELSGPDYFNSSATYTTGFPSTYDIEWSVTSQVYNSNNSQDYESEVTTYTGQSINLTVDPNATDQKFTIQAIGTSPAGVRYKVSKVARHVVISPQTGLLRWSSESSNGNYVGEINMSSPSSSEIIVYPGSKLYFYYASASGADSTLSPDYFDFEIVNDDQPFTKDIGTNNTFTCGSISSSSCSIVLFVYSNGVFNQFKIQITIKH